MPQAQVRADAFYLFVDGMSETVLPETSLSIAKTPNFDRIFSAGLGGFYSPVIAPWHDEPKTDVVIPTFFGFGPEVNPGRPALELVDLGECVRPGTAACFLTVHDTDRRDVRLSVYSEQKILVFLSKMCGIEGAICRESIAYNYGQRFVIGNISQESFNEARHGLGRLGHVEEWKVSDYSLPIDDQREAIEFLGWAKGALRGAFRSVGAACNPFNRPLGVFSDWDSLESDFYNYVIPQLSSDKSETTNYVLYTKETTFASRREDRSAKIRAIEAMDNFLAIVIEQLKPDTVIFIASDHSCDIGDTTNPPENTLFAIARVSDLLDTSSKVRKFCESTLASAKPRPIQQRDLITTISGLRS